MIYNWDDEHISLFGGGDGYPELTPEEAKEVEEKIRKTEEAHERGRILKNIIKNNGWIIKNERKLDGWVEVRIDPNDTGYSDKFNTVVSIEEFDFLRDALIRLGEESKKLEPLNEISYHIDDDGTLARRRRVYRIDEDYDFKERWVIKKIWIYDEYAHFKNFRNLEHLKEERPALYKYLEKYEKCFWQWKDLPKRVLNKMSCEEFRKIYKIKCGVIHQIEELV